MLCTNHHLFQVAIDTREGSLRIPTAQLSDIDIYNCTLHLTNEEGEPETRVYSHQLSVISEPIFWLKMSIEYDTRQCNHVEMKLIRGKLGDWLESHVCSDCEIHNDTVHCVRDSDYSGEEDGGYPSIYKIHLVVSAIGLQIQMEKHIADRCKVTCLELIQSKLMENVRDSLVKLFSLPSKI